MCELEDAIERCNRNKEPVGPTKESVRCTLFNGIVDVDTHYEILERNPEENHLAEIAAPAEQRGRVSGTFKGRN